MNNGDEKEGSELFDGRLGQLSELWNSTQAAPDYEPVPAGIYDVDLVSGKRFFARTTGTPGYLLTLRIVGGEYEGQMIWYKLWLTPRGISHAKKELAKLGLYELGQLEQTIPKGIRCRVRVVLQTRDDGTMENRVRNFIVTFIDENPNIDPDFGPIGQGEDSNTAGEGNDAIAL